MTAMDEEEVGCKGVCNMVEGTKRLWESSGRLKGVVGLHSGLPEGVK